MARNTFCVDEQTRPDYSFSMTDSADGSTIPESSLQTLTLTYYNVADGSIINSRDDQDIKDTNNVVVASLGTVTWTLQDADTTIQDTSATEVDEYERHRALFTWTYTSSDGLTKSGRDEIDILVKNLGKVT